MKIRTLTDKINPAKKNSRTAAAGKPKRQLGAILLALILMILMQCIVIGINEGSIAGIIPKLFASWLNILRNNSYTGIIALGLCFVIISGGIDLSVGSMICALGAFLMYLTDASAGFFSSIGITGAAAILLSLIVVLFSGAVLGYLNGLLISCGKIPPFIVTLGTMKIFRSVTQQLTKNFNPVVPDGLKQIASFKIGNQVILPILYWLILVVIMEIILKKTAFGRRVIAVGSNEKAAAYAGIRTGKIKRCVYVISGVLCAVAAIIYVARIGSMDFANAGSGFEMEGIAAVIVGGTAMSGGRGDVIGAFLGMLIIGIMNNILNMLGVPTFLCDAVRGAIIIVAVLVQRRQSE